ETEARVERREDGGQVIAEVEPQDALDEPELLVRVRRAHLRVAHDAEVQAPALVDEHARRHTRVDRECGTPVDDEDVAAHASRQVETSPPGFQAGPGGERRLDAAPPRASARFRGDQRIAEEDAVGIDLAVGARGDVDARRQMGSQLAAKRDDEVGATLLSAEVAEVVAITVLLESKRRRQPRPVPRPRDTVIEIHAVEGAVEIEARRHLAITIAV